MIEENATLLQRLLQPALPLPLALPLLSLPFVLRIIIAMRFVVLCLARISPYLRQLGVRVCECVQGGTLWSCYPFCKHANSSATRDFMLSQFLMEHTRLPACLLPAAHSYPAVPTLPPPLPAAVDAALSAL